MSRVYLPAPLNLPQSTRKVARADLLPEIRLGLGLIGGFLLLTGVWSCVARLDAAVHAHGVLRGEGDRQIIQNTEGGSIARLSVREGEHVHKGQLLVRFASATAYAQERALAVRVIGLQADIERLRALQQGSPSISEPAEYAAYTGENRVEAEKAMRMARGGFGVDRNLESAESAITTSQVNQIGAQASGSSERMSAEREQMALNERELIQVQALASKGFAPLARVLSLQRSRAALAGEQGALHSEQARLRGAQGEAKLNLLRERQSRLERRADSLRAAQLDLATALPQWQAAQEVLNRTSISAPVDGTVMSLSVLADGAVAGAGQRLMEIVPDDPSWSVEAKVAAADAAALRPGQNATLRIDGMGGRSAPHIAATVTQVSAASLSDEKTGATFYLVRLRIDPGAVNDALRHAAVAGRIRPGTPVSLDIPLYRRSAIEYWLEPLRQSLDQP